MGIIAGKNASVLENWLYSWINAGVQLVGYYAAALSVDVKFWGRRRMTVFSFFMVSPAHHHGIHSRRRASSSYSMRLLSGRGDWHNDSIAMLHEDDNVMRAPKGEADPGRPFGLGKACC